MKARDPRPSPSPSRMRVASEGGGDMPQDGHRQTAPAGTDGRAILRVSRDRDHPYTIINNTPLRDTRLSWKARGLIGYLLTMPDDWRVMVCHLVKQSPCGRDATYTGLRELEDAGYIRRRQVRDERGRMGRAEYLVYEVPQEPEPPHTDFPYADGTLGAEGIDPHTGFPYTDNPYPENPPLLMTDPDEERKSNKTNQSGRRARDPRGASATPEPRDPRDTGVRHVADASEPAPAVPARGVARSASPGGDRESPTESSPDGLPAVPEPTISAAVPHVADSAQALAVPEPAQPQAAMDPAATCAAYRALTGLDDLLPQALDAVLRRRPLTQACVTAKLSLLGDALAAGTVRNPRGFLLAALERDWTAETVPQAPAANPARAPVQPLAAALAALGVTGTTAERLAGDDPEETQRQLDWLPGRAATDPAAVIVTAIREHWPEPAALRERRLADARLSEQARWSAEMSRLQAECLTPEARERGLAAIAQIRAQLG